MSELQSIKNRFDIIGNSPLINHALDVAVQVAPTDLSVLIMGESGVGKEVFSKIIHDLSPRKHNPFLAVNCGAIPEGTIDSELFGHEKGAFTGAVDQRKGYFETVNGGTIFLDEIGEMPLGTQARLLRVLESGEYIRVGSTKVLKTDVRVIAATNIDLLAATQKGKFREDLYYRLNTVPLRVPALKDRKEDIWNLFRKFMADFSERYSTPIIQLTDDARNFLVNYPWPGNVREVKNVAEQVSVLSKTTLIDLQDLQQYFPKPSERSLLPMLSPKSAALNGYSNESELLYKLVFDLKKELADLKKMFVDILQNSNISSAAQENAKENILRDIMVYPEVQRAQNTNVYQPLTLDNNDPVILSKEDEMHNHEEVEETLNIMEKEKELIVKALKKHKNKRKDAAADLGISERTLYRKLKEYDIDL